MQMTLVTPLIFLGGSFYSIKMLPPFWQKIALVNPVVYFLSGFRWRCYHVSNGGVGASFAATLGVLVICLGAATWIFRTRWRLRTSPAGSMVGAPDAP